MRHHAHHFESHNHSRHSDHSQHLAPHSTPHSAKSILLAFLLSLTFSALEFVGGLFTGSVAIMSDSIHSLGDALSTGLACLFEYLDQRHHHSHERYSLLGACFTTAILFIGSAILIYEAIERILAPAEVNADGMIIFAIFGIAFNFLAARVTRHGHSLNQKSVNLHMLEDCLAWFAVLLGAVVMRFTGIHLIDPILSIAVAFVTLYFALQNLHAIIAAFRTRPTTQPHSAKRQAKPTSHPSK